MKVKTAYLIGPALDWAVAKAQGRTEIKIFSRTRPNDRGWIEVRFNPEPKAATARFDPSENWDQGGPIIEREKISVGYERYGAPGGDTWDAVKATAPVDGSLWLEYGPTPLIAAMRCYCCAKLGDVVDIPDELCE